MIVDSERRLQRRAPALEGSSGATLPAPLRASSVAEQRRDGRGSRVGGSAMQRRIGQKLVLAGIAAFCVGVPGVFAAEDGFVIKKPEDIAFKSSGEGPDIAVDLR